MILSAFTFAAMSVFIRFAGDVPPAEKVFFRMIISAGVLFVMIKHKKLPLIGKKWHFKLLLTRSILGVLGIYFYYYGINYVYLADASIISRLNPFFVTFFAWIFLKEKLPNFQIISLIIVFVGAVMIIKPKLSSEFLPSLAIVGAALFTGASHTIVRALHFKEHPYTIVFFFSFASAVMLLPFVLPNFVIPTPIQLLHLVGQAIMGLLSQIFLTVAFRHAKASEVSIYSYTIIIFGAIFGYIFWGEISDALSMIGGFLIVAASIALFFKQRNA